jgi:hypothetical protein
MAELVKEALKYVDHRKVKGRDVVRLYTSNYIPSKQTSPLFVIDGVISKNPSQFLALNPENVITIKLIKDSKKLTRFGELSKYGVIIVKTKTPSAKNEITKKIEGFLMPYNVKVRAKMSARIPDLRPSLLWVPGVDLKSSPATIRFSTSNDVGDYNIIVKGHTINGIPFYQKQLLKVQYKKSH